MFAGGRAAFAQPLTQCRSSRPGTMSLDRRPREALGPSQFTMTMLRARVSQGASLIRSNLPSPNPSGWAYQAYFNPFVAGGLGGQCTAFAFDCALEVTGKIMDFDGNPKTWVSYNPLSRGLDAQAGRAWDLERRNGQRVRTRGLHRIRTRRPCHHHRGQREHVQQHGLWRRLRRCPADLHRKPDGRQNRAERAASANCSATSIFSECSSPAAQACGSLIESAPVSMRPAKRRTKPGMPSTLMLRSYQLPLAATGHKTSWLLCAARMIERLLLP